MAFDIWRMSVGREQLGQMSWGMMGVQQIKDAMRPVNIYRKEKMV